MFETSGWDKLTRFQQRANEHFLEYGIRRGRRTSLEEFEEREIIYKRVADFEGLIITREFCEEFIEHTGMSGGPDHYDKDTYRFGWIKHTTTGGFPDSYIDESVTLKIGKMLNTDQVHKIVAAESGTSLSTVTAWYRSHTATGHSAPLVSRA